MGAATVGEKLDVAIFLGKAGEMLAWTRRALRESGGGQERMLSWGSPL
jgi:hypothetical protein